MKALRPALLAVQFLTRLPVQLADAPAPGEADVGRSVLYYPLVGLLVGAIVATVAVAATRLHLPNLPAAALALAAWVLVTGGLHLDGLADSADAWAGGRGDRQRTLDLMKDPHCGPMAVTVIVLVLLAKFAALEAVVARGHAAQLVIAPVLARTALPLLLATTPYIRPGGLGSSMSGHLPRKAAVAVVLAVCLGLPAMVGAAGAAATVASALVFYILRGMMLFNLGGTTGDTAGATVELVETAAIAAITAVI